MYMTPEEWLDTVRREIPPGLHPPRWGVSEVCCAYRRDYTPSITG